MNVQNLWDRLLPEEKYLIKVYMKLIIGKTLLLIISYFFN